MKKILLIALTLGCFGFENIVWAETTTAEKVEAEGREAKTSVKKAGRKASDEGCEMVNGKMQCLGKKAKHKMENAKDSAKNKAESAKDSVD
jgi:hypothetical protein